MMKKTKKLNKAILLSALSALAFGGIAAGTTYALFTSTAETSVSVSTGKVAVTSAVDQDSVYTKQLGDEDFTEGTDSMYSGSGSVAFSGNNIELNHMVPGDAVKFKINVTNESTVTTKIRTLIKTSGDTGLAAALKIKVNGTEFPGLAITDWTTTEAKSGNKEVAVEIELPEEAGNDCQNKSCTLVYSTEAVQGNAAVRKAIVVTPATSGTTTVSVTENNMDIYFAPGEYKDCQAWFHGKENISLIGCEGAKFDSFTAGYHSSQDSSYSLKTDSTFIIDGLNVEKQLHVSIADQVFIARNCKTSQIYAETYKIDDMQLSFEDNTFKRAASYYYDKDADGNTVAGGSGNAKDGGIFLSINTGNYDLSITGNSFENYIGHAMKVMVNSNTSGANSITVKNNDFISFGYSRYPNADKTYEFTTDNEAAFKMWGDVKYAPYNPTTAEKDLTKEVIDRQTALSKAIYEGNTFSDTIKNHGYFYATNFYDVCYNNLTTNI